MKIDQAPSIQPQTPNISQPDIKQIEGKLTQVQSTQAGLPAVSSTSSTHMEQASNSNHLSKVSTGESQNLLDEAVLKPLLQTTNADERKATISDLKKQLASTKEALHPRQGVMPLLLKSSDAELKNIGLAAMTRYMQTGAVKLASLRSPAFRSPQELRQAASHQWIKQVEDLIKKSKSTLTHNDFQKMHDDPNELEHVRAFAFDKMVEIRPDLHKTQAEPEIQFTTVKLTAAQQDSFATGNNAELNKLIRNPSMPLPELKQALLQEGFSPKVVEGVESHSQFVNMAKSFEQGYKKFNESMKIDVLGQPVPNEKLIDQTIKRSLDIALDKQHPQQPFAKKYLVLAAKNNLIFSTYTDTNKLPLDLSGLSIVKRLSFALDSTDSAHTHAQPFEQNFKQILGMMPNDDLISYANSPGEHHDFKPAFVKQLAENMNKGTFVITQGSAAGKALELGNQYPELKEPSLTFVKGRLASFAKDGNFQPAQMFAQQAGHPLQAFALNLLKHVS